MPRADSPLKGRVLFVVGARRSGTNWLQRILTARPDVAGMPSETYLFSHGIDRLAERLQHATPGLPRTGTSFMSRDAFLDAARDFVDRVFEEHLRTIEVDATRVVERTPWHVHHVDLIAAVYPDAPIVHVIRDGRDVARSLLTKAWGPSTMESAAEEWRSSVTSGRSAGASLPNYVEVFYEQLLADPASGIASLYEQIGLELPPGLLERVLLEAGAEFNVDPSFPGIGSGKWRTALSPSDLRAFDRIAGALLEELGYEREPPPRPHVGETLIRAARATRSRGRAALRPRDALASALDRAHARRNADVLKRNAEIVKRLQDGLAHGRYAVLDELLTPDAVIQAVDEGRGWRARGGAGAARLRGALEAHEKLGVRPLSGEVLPSVDMFTLVGTYRLGDGSLWSRTLIVTFRHGRVIGLALHRYRLAGAPDTLARPAERNYM